MLVELQEAVFGYRDKAVVRVRHLRLMAGRCLGIFGPNGVGKTTLVRGTVGLLRPLAGSLEAVADLRFGYLPQHRALDLQWPMTGLDAASMAVSARRPFGWVGHARRRVRESMRSMEVDDLAHLPFAKLSGGQQQRVLLAGALSADPQVLVLDEPTDGLDVRSRRTLLDVLREQTSAGLCTVVISHEVEDLLYICDEIAWLHPSQTGREPSEVEIINPEALAGRVTQAPWAVAS